MNKETILSRQILTYMLLLTFVIIAIAILGSYLFYSFLIYYLPGGMNEGSEDAMTFLDWMWILMASITSLVVALFFTVKLSARIFNPLNDVAYSLKQISQGNLSARAFNSSSKLGEMNRLVNDFNEMAEKLQTLDAQRNLWNAAIARVVSSSGGAGYSLMLSEVDLKATISNALDTFWPDFDKKHFKIVTEINQQYCVCDPLRIIQCLTVLFDNALKYSTSQRLLIKNGITGNDNFIIVQDQGPGIPEELQKSLFQPFQRGEYAKNINPEGCGLGLSVVKAIMCAHGGDVSYSLTPENGSLFKLSWPV